MDAKAHEERHEPHGDALCPWCGAAGRQRWLPFVVGYEYKGGGAGYALRGIGRESDDLVMSLCGSCGRTSLWHARKPVWPGVTDAPPAAPGMPSEARAVYEEARQVVDRSPRAATALLRLSLQRVFSSLGLEGAGEAGRSSAWSLPPEVWQALRAVRAAGEDAVPPGRLDDGDDMERARALFDLVNVIVERLIEEPERWRRS